jgi:RNA polymerase sigma-70 factor (ECF subfamily)
MQPKREEDQPVLQQDESPPTWGSATDAWLVEQGRRGNYEALGELVRRYESRLVRVLYRFVGDRELARDLAQETFLRVYCSLEKFDPSRRFGPWLFRVALNLATDWMRGGKHLSTVQQLRQHAAGRGRPSETNAVEQLELVEEVRRVLQGVPYPYRIVLILRDLEGLTTSEIAAITGRTEATVRWRLAQGRHMFRRLWEERQEGERLPERNA